MIKYIIAIFTFIVWLVSNSIGFNSKIENQNIDIKNQDNCNVYFDFGSETIISDNSYVINPTSYNALVQNVDYNDDSNNSTNASLTKYFDTNITYLIVFCQYNPTHIFSNLDTGDDIILRINRV